MTDLQTDSIADLEEHFTLEIPCGGNIYPISRPCPDKAPAVLANVHAYCRGGPPQDFKCFNCYSQWLRGHLDNDYSVTVCANCHLVVSATEVYRIL